MVDRRPIAHFIVQTQCKFVRNTHSLRLQQHKYAGNVTERTGSRCSQGVSYWTNGQELGGESTAGRRGDIFYCENTKDTD